MKKITTCLFLTFLYLTTISQENKFTIKGKLSSLKDTTLTLSSGLHFTQQIKTDKSGAFNATVKGERGYYHLGSVGLFYLAPGDALSVLRSGADTVLTGKGSVENNILRKPGRQSPSSGKL